MKSMRPFALTLCSLVMLAGARAQDLPAGAGKDTLEKVCTTCHGLEAIVTVQGNKDIWQSVVDDMKGRGADGSNEDFTAIVNYLGKYFGPNVNVNTATAKAMTDDLGLTAAEAD